MTSSRRHLARKPARCGAGYTLIDLIVGLLVTTVVGLFVIMAMPRGRETARSTSCQRNLSQIGQAFVYYDGTQGFLPTISEPISIDSPDAVAGAGPGPLKVLLESLGVASFLKMEPEGRNLGRLQATLPEGVPVAGFLCPSDAQASQFLFPSPVSYRATTGDDPAGRTGGFAFGRKTSLKEIESQDGQSFTAAFSERLVGDGQPRPSPANYLLVTEPLTAEGCSTTEGDWRGDAGSSWVQADYRTTLYNHALTPGSKISCLNRDGRSAYMGASSGHVRGVYLLMFDGSARLVGPSVDPRVWRSYATVQEAPSEP